MLFGIATLSHNLSNPYYKKPWSKYVYQTGSNVKPDHCKTNNEVTDADCSFHQTTVESCKCDKAYSKHPKISLH
jgi:hypothetical protein